MPGSLPCALAGSARKPRTFPEPFGESNSTVLALSRESSLATCWASANLGLSASSSMLAVMPPTANFAALARKARRSIEPWTY
jgi:hypothetical protein